MKGRVTNTSSLLLEAPFSLEESLGAGGSFVGLGAISLVGSFSFSTTPAYSTSLGGTVEERAASVEAAWLDSKALGMASVWELEGLAM